MTDGRRFVALMLVSFAVGLAIFGIVRGLSATGPAHGVRFIATIAPPVDDNVRTMAEHTARERVAEPGTPARVVAAGEQLVIELGEDDPAIVGDVAAVLQRTAKLELHAVDASSAWLAQVAAFAATDREAGGIRVEAGAPIAEHRESLAAYVAGLTARNPALAPPADRLIAYGRTGAAWRPYVLERAGLVDPSTIARVELIAGGVAVDTRDAPHLTLQAPVAVMLDGVVRFAGGPDRVDATAFHLPTHGANDEAAIIEAMELVAMIEAGAAHPIHIVQQEAFSRATGFVPRAAPFLAIGVALAIAGLLAWRRR